MRTAIEAIGIFIVFTLVTMTCQATDVEYCKDARTGQIIVVKAGMPCPFPMHKI